MGCLFSCLSFLRDCWRSLWTSGFTEDANAWLEFMGEEPFVPLDTEEIELSDITGTGVRSSDTVATVAAGVPDAGAVAVAKESAKPAPKDYLSLLPEALARRILSMLDDESLLRASMAFVTWGDLCRWEPALRVRVEEQVLREVPSETDRGVDILWRFLDDTSLRQASRVCRRWRRLCLEDPELRCRLAANTRTSSGGGDGRGRGRRGGGGGGGGGGCFMRELSRFWRISWLPLDR